MSIVTVVVVLVAGIAAFAILGGGGETSQTDTAATSVTPQDPEPQPSEVQETSQDIDEPTSEPPSNAESEPLSDPQPIYATTVDYSNERIPDRVFDNTLNWSFDVCVADLEFLKPANLRKIQVRDGVGGPEIDIEAKGVQGGRCQASEVNLTFEFQEPVPPAESIGTGWSACRPYRVVLPETANFARSTIDFCVRTRAEPA